MNNKSKELNLYNNILSLSRKKFFYTKFALADTFQNRINLVFLHISFIFIRAKQNSEISEYKNFHQKLFDLLFKQIELNMRELGYGDVSVNKNMKYLVKTFYNILLFCENYSVKDKERKKTFFNEHLECSISKNTVDFDILSKYFDDFQTFCFDLTADSVLDGELKFKFN